MAKRSGWCRHHAKPIAKPASTSTGKARVPVTPMIPATLPAKPEAEYAGSLNTLVALAGGSVGVRLTCPNKTNHAANAATSGTNQISPTRRSPEAAIWNAMMTAKARPIPENMIEAATRATAAPSLVEEGGFCKMRMLPNPQAIDASHAS